MTDQFTSLSPAALKDIVAHLDDSLEVFARQSGELTAADAQIKKMLIALRAKLIEKLENHPDADR